MAAQLASSQEGLSSVSKYESERCSFSEADFFFIFRLQQSVQTFGDALHKTLSL
jgi:hypothetical protein